MIKLAPIYTEAYHLARAILKDTAHLPKAYRPTLGRRLEDAAIDIVVMLRQELLKDAPMQLERVHNRIDELKVVIQLAHDLGIVRDHLFGEWSTAVDKIGKMAGGMARQQKRRGRDSLPGDQPV